MLVIDGYADYGPDLPCFTGIAKVWSLSLDSLRWSEVQESGPRPGARYFSSALLDADARRILVYGGGGGTPYADVWALSLTAAPVWSRVGPDLVPAVSPMRGALHYDEAKDELVTVAGSQLWTRSLKAPVGWTARPILGEGPPRWGSAEILDTGRHRLIWHGGYDGYTWSRDTWVLPLDGPLAWSRLPVTGDPPSSGFGAAIYDPIRERMILSGGYAWFSAFLDRVWELSLDGPSRWAALDEDGSWPTRAGLSAVYDPRNDRMVVFGGGGAGGDSWWLMNDVWALNLSGPATWTQLSAFEIGQRPYPRAFASLVNDPIRNQLLVVGGYRPGFFGSVSLDDAWCFDLAASKWRRVPSNGALPMWGSPNGTYDSRRDQFVFHEYHWLWTLQPTRHEAARQPVRAGSTTLERSMTTVDLSITAEWSSRTLTAEISLPDESASRLELFDITGRRVWKRELNSRRGTLRVEMDELHSIGAGVYLLKLSQGGRSRVARVIHVRS